jgi:hypothetical protein
MERAGGLVSRGGFNVTDPRIVEARKIRQMQLVFDGEAVVRGLMASQISCLHSRKYDEKYSLRPRNCR